jgi:hypothetical protein
MLSNAFKKIEKGQDSHKLSEKECILITSINQEENLFKAISEKDFELVKFLIKIGTNVDAKNKEGQSPMRQLCPNVYDHQDMTFNILNLGAFLLAIKQSQDLYYVHKEEFHFSTIYHECSAEKKQTAIEQECISRATLYWIQSTYPSKLGMSHSKM